MENDRACILLFLEGVLCDTRHRDFLFGRAQFYHPDRILADSPTPGSVAFTRELSEKYRLAYIGARPPLLLGITGQWLQKAGFPEGELSLGRDISDRLEIVRKLAVRYRFAARIGSGWMDKYASHGAWL